MTTASNEQTERDEFLWALEKHRGFLRQTVDGISDEQAAQRTTISELCLGGLLKHVTRMETRWIDFILRGPDAISMDETSDAEHAASFRMEVGDTVGSLLAEYETAARETEKTVRGLPSLDVENPLPQAPWFEPRASSSARRRP